MTTWSPDLRQGKSCPDSADDFQNLLQASLSQDTSVVKHEDPVSFFSRDLSQVGKMP